MECLTLGAQTRNKQSVNFVTCLHLKGGARQGLTRLLDEIVYITPSQIPLNRFTLAKKNRNVRKSHRMGWSKISYHVPNFQFAYHTIREIFSLTLDIKETSTQQDRQDKLQRRMRDVSVPDLLCVLNNVFNVGFHISELYRSLNNEQKQIALKKTIKLLTYYVSNSKFFITLSKFQPPFQVLQASMGHSDRRWWLHRRGVVAVAQRNVQNR